MKPEFVDNSGGNTLAEALRAHLGWLLETYRRPIELAVATGYFNPGGFAKIADALERLPRVRLLLGAEPAAPTLQQRRVLSDPRGTRFTDAAFRRALAAAEAGLREERDLLGFSEEVDATLRRLVAFLRSGRVEVRRYERAFLHGKAFVFAGDEGVIAGSSNFTAAGLTTNVELNLGHYQPQIVAKVSEWFERLWNDARPYDLAGIYEARYREYAPYLIYLRMLWERYGSELQEEAPAHGPIPLATFQTDGLARARRILGAYNGVVVADGVGLGKTFLAGELLREAVQDRRQRALLVSPASLRDGTWRTFKDRYQLYLENVSFEQLAADPSLGGDGQPCLKEPPDRYAVIVVDEAHAFRNPDTERARALRRLLRGTPPKKLVLVTATPVNNSLWDLYYLLTLFVGHDARFADLGIPSLKARFDGAMREDPYELKPDALFDLLDKIVVRRTRNFVRRYYQHDRIRLADGTQVAIRFPAPRVRKIEYDLEGVLPGFFDEVAEALAPDSGEPKLTMARYVPSLYRRDGEAQASQQALVGLLRSALLKRFESSVHAFANTVEKMVTAHDRFLEALAAGYVPTPEFLAEWDEDTASDAALEDLLQEAGAERAERYDVVRLRRDVERDRDLLDAFGARARTLTADRDPKLRRLADALVDVLAHAARDAPGPTGEGDLRKALVFSYYEDTVDWVEGYLRDLFDRDRRFAPYRGRLASVAGRAGRGGVSREAAVFGFTPRSTEAPPGRDDDRYDVLVATDVLAEGLNLQQCRNVINYDLPWNPMRLVQRHGRIDRIGSRHPEVFIRCFFPATKLDELLNLEERLRRKIAQAAAAVGVESPPLPGAATADVVFADTRKEIAALREERPDLFDNAGEDPAAHSGEEYRQELRKGLETSREELESLPWAAGSGFMGSAGRGYLFCVRVFDRVFLRFVPADGGEIVRDALGCLRLGRCTSDTPRHLPADLLTGVYAAWRRAQQDVYAEWTRSTDPANLQPRVRPLFREVAAHLRKHPPEALTQADLEEILASVEAPWGLRIEREIRAAFWRPGTPREVSAAVAAKVREMGLSPYRSPEPLPVIEPEEVALVCWLGLESGEHGT